MNRHKIWHDSRPPRKWGEVILPIGAYYNKALQEMTEGDQIEFWDGTVGIVKGLCKLNIHTAMAAETVRRLYGARYSVADVYERWIAHATIHGHKRDAIDRTECLYIWYEVTD